MGVRLDESGEGGMVGCLVAVSTEPTSVRQNGATVQVLVTEDPSFRLKGERGFLILSLSLSLLLLLLLL